MNFYILNSDAPDGRTFPKRFPLYNFEDLSYRIIQPTEFTREYSEESDTTIPILRAANIEDGNLNLEDLVFVDAEKLLRAESSFIDSGDILITRTGAKAGATCIVPDLPREFAITSHSIRIIPKKELIAPKYVESFLLSRWGKSQITRLFTGAAQKQLQLATVAKIQIPLPPLEIQRSLVAEIEAARQAQKQKLAQADELLASINDYFLIQLGLTPLSSLNSSTRSEIQGFAVKRSNVRRRLDTLFHKPEFYLLEKQLSKLEKQLVFLKNLSTSFTNGDHGGLKYTESGVRYLRGQSITSHGLDLTDELYISLEDHERMIRSEIIPGDVLLTIAGSIGNCCVVRGISRANINQAIVKIRPTSEILPEYLATFLNSDYGRFQTRRLANGAVQLNVNFSEVGDIKVLVPDLEIQRSLVIEIEKRRAGAQRLRQEAEADWETAKIRFEHKLLGEEA